MDCTSTYISINIASIMVKKFNIGGCNNDNNDNNTESNTKASSYNSYNTKDNNDNTRSQFTSSVATMMRICKIVLVSIMIELKNTNECVELLISLHKTSNVQLFSGAIK